MDDEYNALNYDAVTFYDRTYGKLSPYADKVNEPKKKRNNRNSKPSSIRRRKEYWEKRKRTPEYQEKHGCRRKRRYYEEEEAIAAIAEQPDKMLTFYKCCFCEGFHLATVRNEMVK